MNTDDRLDKIEQHLFYIRNTLDGNGREGMLSMVDRHEKKFNEQNGMMRVVIGVGTFLGITNITLFVRSMMQ